MAKTCAFCGESPLTLEHLWPIWVRKLYGHPKGKTPVTEHHIINQPSGVRKRSRYIRYQPSLGYQAKILCEECNHGWTAELNEGARPYVLPMITGQRVSLGKEEQFIVARWATKMAMVFVQTTPVRPIPRNQCRYLKDHRRPPPSSQVWVGVRTTQEGLSIGGVQAYGMSDQPTPKAKKNGAYLVTVGIGHLVFAFFGHDLPFEVLWSRPFIEPIWPVAQTPVVWPPKHVFGSFDDLANDTELESHLQRGLASKGIVLVRL